MTPQISYSEASEFNMKTQQSTSKDEETQSILKLPSSESEIHVQPEAKVEESDNNNNNSIIVERAEEATLPAKEASSVLLTPLMENKIIRNSPPVNVEEGQKQAGEDSGRERLKRHRVEMAGRVWVPDMWGQEGLLKDWIDCSAFDASLMNSNIMLARAALAQQGRRPSSTRIRIENSC